MSNAAWKIWNGRPKSWSARSRKSRSSPCTRKSSGPFKGVAQSQGYQLVLGLRSADRRRRIIPSKISIASCKAWTWAAPRLFIIAPVGVDISQDVVKTLNSRYRQRRRPRRLRPFQEPRLRRRNSHREGNVKRYSYRRQRTIARPVEVQGIGYITGKKVRLRFDRQPTTPASFSCVSIWALKPASPRTLTTSSAPTAAPPWAMDRCR